jgi:hypothetical protein
VMLGLFEAERGTIMLGNVPADVADLRWALLP